MAIYKVAQDKLHFFPWSTAGPELVRKERKSEEILATVGYLVLMIRGRLTWRSR